MPTASEKRKPSNCPECGAVLFEIDYKTWGRSRFDPQSGSYHEDDSPGNSDIEVSCTKCDAKLNPEGLLF